MDWFALLVTLVVKLAISPLLSASHVTLVMVQNLLAQAVNALMENIEVPPLSVLFAVIPVPPV